jgi:hypothetical protein
MFNKKISSPIVSILSYIFFFLSSILFVSRPSLQNKFVLPLINVTLIDFTVFNTVIFFLIVQVLGLVNKKKDLRSKLNKYFIFSSATFILVSYYLGFLEKSNYANYLYSNYGIDALLLEKISKYHLIAVATLSLSRFFIVNEGWIINSKDGIRRVVKSLSIKILDKGNFLAIIASILLFQVLSGSLTVIENEIEVYTSFSENGFDLSNKVVDLPDLERRTEFVKRNTPENSAIIHPPQSDRYAIEGNQVLLRYFTYPRTLVTKEKISKFMEQKSEDQDVYILIVPEWNDDGYYPHEIFPAKEVLLLLTNGNEIKLENTTYTPQLLNEFEKIDIGIIKI